jgi:hypothetical protein
MANAKPKGNPFLPDLDKVRVPIPGPRVPWPAPRPTRKGGK